MVCLKGILALDAELQAYVRYLSVLALLAWRADFDGDDAALGWFCRGIGDEEGVLADLDELIIRKVWSVPLNYYPVGEGRIDFLFERERVLAVGHPVEEWVVPLPAREYLVDDLERKLDVAVCRLVVDPLPEFGYPVEWVVQVTRSNEDVRVEEEHCA